jgi:hypothetical protein
MAAIGRLFVEIGGLVGAAAAAGAELFHLSESLSGTALQLRNQSILSGLTADDMQAMNRLGKEAGLETENLARILGQLNRQLATGEKEAFIKVLNALRLQAGEAAAEITALLECWEGNCGPWREFSFTEPGGTIPPHCHFVETEITHTIVTRNAGSHIHSCRMTVEKLE